MLLTKNINIKVTKTNINSLLLYGYNTKLKDILNIDIKHLSKSSNKYVNVSCDICGIKYQIKYQRYNNQINKHNKLCCQKCKFHNIKETNLEKYGDETFNNRTKYKKTCLLRYGVENTARTTDVKNKIKETNLQKYGVEYPLSSEIIKETIKETCLKKYGVENVSQSEKIKKKKEDTCILNYGVENPFQSETIKETIKETCLEKYGVENVSQSEEIKKKKKDTCFKNYGKHYYTQTTEYLEKTGKILPNQRTAYEKYRLCVNNYTNKIRKEIINKWDGIDYYDGEYIMDNFNLNSNNSDYPTLDHKISVLFGFLNDVDVDKLCDITNICITKRKTNSQKNSKNEIDFKKNN